MGVHKERHIILVAGSLAYDKILDFPGRFSDHILPDKIHNISVSFMTENLSESFGGTAGNIAYNLALLGEKPVVLSAAGNDFDAYEYWLDSKGVDLTHVRRVKNQPTAFVTVLTDKNDNQITAVYAGAAAEPCAIDDKDIPKANMAIVAPGNVKDMSRFPEVFRKLGIPFIFDPGQQTTILEAEDIKNGIKGAKIVIANDYELSLIMGKTGWREADILEHAEMLVTTFGAEGSEIRTRQEAFKIPPVKASEVKDPTGAGDAYRAGLVVGLLRGWTLPMAGRFASTVAAFAVEGVGPQFHNFSFHEVWGRYTESFGEELPA